MLPKSLLFLAFLLCFSAKAQNIYVSGVVTDSLSGETLIGVNLKIVQLQTGSISNEFGQYSLVLKSNELFTIRVSYLGFETKLLELKSSENLKLNIALKPNKQQLNEVFIDAEGINEKLRSNQMGIESINSKELKSVPSLFGEADIMRVLQLKPGVLSAGEGSTGMFVRGGSYDQNLILLDDAQLYNASHLFGFFSTFNSDIVKDVKLYKADFPAQFGGKLSSVIDVRTMDGDLNKQNIQGSFGLLSSKITLDGPIIKKKASYVLSYRRTYVDLFTDAINKKNQSKPKFTPIPKYYFYDLNFKANYKLSDKDVLYLGFYSGSDQFGFNAPSGSFQFKLNWGNTAASLRWNRMHSARLSQNTTFSITQYDYSIKNQFSFYNYELGSNITDANAKTDLFYKVNNRTVLKTGVYINSQKFDIGRFQLESNDSSVAISVGNQFSAISTGAYLLAEQEITPELNMNYGFRVSNFLHQNNWNAALEPRVSVRYLLPKDFSIKASYAHMVQYIHLVSNSGGSLPMDVWYPTRNKVLPQQSDQVALGVSKKLFGNYYLNYEVYYKWLKNQIDFKDNADLFVNKNLEEEFVYGKGSAYGNEIYIEKKSGKFTGWVAYTLSWAWREFDAIMGGKAFHPIYDSRHNISVVGMYKINERWDISATWVYSTGRPTTLPVGRFLVQDVPGSAPFVVPEYTDRNAFRLNAYNRLDVGANYKLKSKRGQQNLNFSVYNAYDRRNPYFIYFDEERNASNTILRFVAKQVSLFPILPSVSYNFKF